jgi:hypothetical protein
VGGFTNNGYKIGLLKVLALEIPMKSVLLALVVFASLLTYSRAEDIPKTPTPPATTIPTPTPQPIIEAGGLDAVCQSGLNIPYKMNDDGTFGTNGPAESQALSDASACIGYITGWAHTISGTFIMEEDQLWYVEVNDQFTALKEVDALHELLKANPAARKVPSPLILLNVAVDKKMATIEPVKIENLPQGQPQSEPNPVPPTLKSKV